MSKKAPVLAVFWGDTRELLTKTERVRILQDAILESITPSDVLLRDRISLRLVVITSTAEKKLFCSLCKNDDIRSELGKTCPQFAECTLKSRGGIPS
jgi:hypothetical protein